MQDENGPRTLGERLQSLGWTGARRKYDSFDATGAQRYALLCWLFEKIDPVFCKSIDLTTNAPESLVIEKLEAASTMIGVTRADRSRQLVTGTASAESNRAYIVSCLQLAECAHELERHQDPFHVWFDREATLMEGVAGVSSAIFADDLQLVPADVQTDPSPNPVPTSADVDREWLQRLHAKRTTLAQNQAELAHQQPQYERFSNDRSQVLAMEDAVGHLGTSLQSFSNAYKQQIGLWTNKTKAPVLIGIGGAANNATEGAESLRQLTIGLDEVQKLEQVLSTSHRGGGGGDKPHHHAEPFTDACVFALNDSADVLRRASAMSSSSSTTTHTARRHS